VCGLTHHQDNNMRSTTTMIQGGSMFRVTKIPGFKTVVAITTFLVTTAPALAGQYVLEKGQGLDVCEAYKRNFESFDNLMPMACERKYDPTIKGFSSPPWQRLDLQKHFELYKKADIYRQRISGRLSKADADEYISHAAERARGLKAELYLARLDLDGDGKLTNVLAIREMTCGPYHTGERTRLYVLNETLTDIDYARQNSWGGWDYNATVELYRGKPYIEAYNPDDGWGNLFTKSGRFYVFRELSLNEMAQQEADLNGKRWRLKSVCEFQYTPSSEKNK